MNWKQVTGIYFSPTGSTKRAAELIGKQIGGGFEYVDLTDAGGRCDCCFTENEVVVVGTPVYGGRVPVTAAERLRKLHGRQTPAVCVVCYGNRAYEDALLELANILLEQGFRPAAAAAVVAEHNMVRSIAAGRPDRQDQERLAEFARQVKEKLLALPGSYQIPKLSVGGNFPYREYHTPSLKIRAGASCSGCGVCIRSCPVQAISRTDPRITDTERCIGCMRCVSVCPEGGRKVSGLVMLAVTQKLKKSCAERKEPEFFL